MARKRAQGRTSAGRVPATVDDVLRSLERRGSQANVEGMARYGIVASKIFGVSVAELRGMAKELGRDHDLALQLWNSGWHEARMLACFVADPAVMTAGEMDRWARDFENWAITDTVCLSLFDRTPHAWRKVDQWSRRRAEFVRRAGFALLAAMAQHDKGGDDAEYRRRLALIETSAADDRNFVKKAVSWALRAVGSRSVALNRDARRLAKKLAASTNAAERWVGKDAMRKLNSGPTQERLKRTLRIMLACAAGLPSAGCAVQAAREHTAADVAALHAADTALVNVANVVRRIAPEMAASWPGFWARDEPFLVYRPGAAALLVTEAVAPAGFDPLHRSVLPAALRGITYLHAGPLPGLEGAYFIDYPVGPTTATAVALDDDGTAATIATLFHEAFHGYQARRFVSTLPPAGEYVDAAAIAQPEFRAKVEVERRMLLDALRLPADSLPDRLRAFLAVRWLRLRAVDASVRAVERHLERVEGSAHLIGLQAGLLAAEVARDSLAAAVQPYLDYPLDSRGGGAAERLIRWRVYGTGAALGVLLDRLHVPWRRPLEDGRHFDELLAETLAFDSTAAVRLAPAALEAFGFADLLASAALAGSGIESLADFFELAPVRLELELSVPVEDARLQMDMNFSAGSAGFAQIEPSLLALPAPDVLSLQLPGTSLVVRDRPVLWDTRGMDELIMRVTVLLPDLPDLPDSSGAWPTTPGAHTWPRLDVTGDGVNLTIEEPVTVQATPHGITIRVRSRPPEEARARGPGPGMRLRGGGAVQNRRAHHARIQQARP